ncbi:putative aldouronate transport system substrate-binding protein [Clostridium sp. USBA 49]|jgi:putative aldouronate transport system substrate-binding protein|uniref:extracellular solute-binding protein n=1 Tax=Clostridium TaxID=1485 RepID=UPI00099A91BE|nr:MULTISPECIES: extracellular solute-binding protein [Clostridium]SKA78291.1 putative aldouronate transport system substrate-binding protein [Clostridium sp. USBA 49]
MKKTKLLTSFLTLTMLAATLTSCNKADTKDVQNTVSKKTSSEPGPFGKYNEPVTLRLVRTLDPNVKFDEGQSIEKNGYIDEIKKNLNIDIKFDWICAPGDWDQKISLAISSNNLPDAVIVDTTKFNAMLKFDQIADLTSVYNDYACDLLKSFYNSGGESLKKLTERDGKIMGIPATSPKANGFNEMWIRQDWLKKLNLKVPTNMEELKATAKAFVEQDPDGNGKKDTIGIVGPAKSGTLAGTDGNQFGLDPIFSAHQSYPGYWLKDSNGKVVYGSTQPETKKALEALSNMYKEGLIDKELLVRDDSMQPVLDGKAGIFFGPWWEGYNIADVYKQNPAPDWQAYASPRAEDGNYYVHLSSPATNFLVVNKNCKNPEAAVKVINLLLRDEAKWIENGLSKNTGTGAAYPLFAVFDNVDELESSYNILNKYMKGETTIEDVDFSTHKLLKGDMEAIKKLKKEPLDDYSINNWDLKSDLVSSNLPRLVSIMVGDRPLSTEKNIKEVYSLYYGQTDTMTSRWSNLQKLEKETFAKIIMGTAPIDSFDDFVNKWNAQGGEKILKEIAEISK